MKISETKMKRKDLFEEITNILRQWPDLERKIFAQAHYHGQSPEAISRSLKLDTKEVSTILSRCERQLQISLRNFRKSSRNNPLLTPVKPATIAACP
jgi:DNA-directed RNA polymerase specialized sigma24 family protein